MLAAKHTMQAHCWQIKLYFIDCLSSPGTGITSTSADLKGNTPAFVALAHKSAVSNYTFRGQTFKSELLSMPVPEGT